jgi:hypothetical protein
MFGVSGVGEIQPTLLQMINDRGGAAVDSNHLPSAATGREHCAYELLEPDFDERCSGVLCDIRRSM